MFRSHSLLPQIYSFLYSLNFTSFLFLNPSHQICVAHIFLTVWPSTAAWSASQGLYSWRKWTLCGPGLGLHAHLLSPRLHLVWMELVQVICWCPRCWEFIYGAALICPKDAVSLQSPTTVDLTLFPPFPPKQSLNLTGRPCDICDIDVPFSVECSSVSYSLYLYPSWSSVLIFGSKGLLRWVWRDAVVYGNIKSPGVLPDLLSKYHWCCCYVAYASKCFIHFLAVCV